MNNESHAHRLQIKNLVHDETGPLSIIIPAGLAAPIRRQSLWAGKHPQQFVVDWLSAGFPTKEKSA
jgi:hypothetical protein